MAVITISRELAALGDETAKELAKSLSYRFVDKITLENRIKACGVSSEKLEKYDERKPSFFAALSQDRDDYLHYLRQAMLEEAAAGSCVIIGRGASAVLAGLPGVIPVFLVSQMEQRISRVRSYFHCDEKRARQIIASSDEDRAGFHKYFFEMAWKDQANYLLTLNTSLLHPASCAETIKLLLSRLITDETERALKIRLGEQILAQRVVHHVLYEKKLGVHFFEADVSGNVTTLFGVANSQALLEAVVAVVKDMPGVSIVTSDIQVVQEYSIMP